MRQCVFIENQSIWTTLMQDKLLDIFYSYEYVHLNARPEESPGLIYFQGQSGELFYPFLKRRIFETRYFDIITPYGYGGPEIVGELTKQELADAKRSFRQWAMRNQIVSELIRFNPLTENEKQVPDWTEREFVRHTTSIDLRPSVEEIMQTFHKKNRSMIRKSLASDLSVRIGTNDDLQTFIRLYYQTMDRKDASLNYYFTSDYFEQLFKPTPLCRPLLLIAEWQGEAVGAYFVLLGQKYAHGHLIGCERDEHKLYPNQRLEYEAILYSKAAGMVEQHLGGGYKERDSLFESKCRYTGYRMFEYHQGKTILLPHIYEQLCERHGSDKEADYFPEYRYQETVLSR
ncbi:peptidoglycan bridge formation glycyltransferase FemA/FemB family protein [Exiguobacterium antarcticum]|uniref:peptidoglycan bridge formation glycyltransferase FemA/FemB family protein n=1 Tax=Exiguobacterium antarcticum TaxID=132920 RepID=UPI00047C2AAA|nr:peptidoglycan bridge formation glycyltransferase FemA/FemB family protein [Exiguobacterium antarcticum]